MNPPSALHSAMNRDRKPFTYTPGGIDLSEIKSERMAKRLMRNAMDQGVPETPAHLIHSPPTPSTPIQNFNCLPVQVFPTFALPSNPKSLLRTRSTPDPPAYLNNTQDKILESNKKPDLNSVDAKWKPYAETKQATDNVPFNEPINYGSSGHTFQSYPYNQENSLKKSNPDYLHLKYDLEEPYNHSMQPIFRTIPEPSPNVVIDLNSNIATSLMEEQNNNKEEIEVEPAPQKSVTEDVPIKENGDTDTAITVKLPSKKSEVKSETKVEVSKKTLPNGSVQEVKKTITKTTIDGKTEIKTETETTTIPKQEDDEIEYEVEEEEEEEDVVEEDGNNEEVVESNYLESKKNVGCERKSTDEVYKESVEDTFEKDNKEEELEQEKDIESKGLSDTYKTGQVITQEEKLESSTTKRVVIVHSEEDFDKPDSECHNEIKDVLNYEENDQECVDAKADEIVEINIQSNVAEESQLCDDDKPENDEVETRTIESQIKTNLKPNEDNDEKELISENGVENEDNVSETYEEAKEGEDSSKLDDKVMKDTETKDNVDETEDMPKDSLSDQNQIVKNVVEELNLLKPQQLIDGDHKDIEIPIKVEYNETISQQETKSREPSSDSNVTRKTEQACTVPLDKVEEIEIKPIGPVQEITKKTHTEIITTTSDKPASRLSTQTEFNIIENFVTVNRTTKTLDHAYEEIPDNIPEIKTFAPPDNHRILISPPPHIKTFQPVFSSEPTERRHSLLLDRISVERQMPSEIIHNSYISPNQFSNNQQYPQEPQSEVLVVNNVKPSAIIKNQQWYQRHNENTNCESMVHETYQNDQWQESQPLRKPHFKCQSFPKPVQQPRPQTEQSVPPPPQNAPRIQPSPQPIYQTMAQQTPFTTHPVNQVQEPPKPIYQLQPQYQQTYHNTSQENFSISNNNYEQNIYPSHKSQNTWTPSNWDIQSQPNPQSNQYSYLTKEVENIQNSTREFKSSYVPPPWEQDPKYVVDNAPQTHYQPAPTKPQFSANQPWKSSKPTNKFTKTTTSSYTPPAPNQSFVKAASTTESSKTQGRKTYYSEYERRFISVPESNYLPSETKYQPQPDPSPQYYYDNNEPAEIVEPQWRKELREFKEKTTTHTEETTVRPPWEEDPKYSAPKDFTPTQTPIPTWTQTLKPRSWRERSYEPEHIASKEWPKTNSLRRGRPQSSYIKNHVDRVPERIRGVSVDRYNPNSYQPPLTKLHPAPATHVLDPIIQSQTYHNPNVPAYHARASAEPREQPISYQQPRASREPKAAPVQSRSFKYLQWITGTED
ncbi:unnamed protein product [Leptidea sinapis]|uniref:Zasp-like motif domain-containing protein n=1 Tax=Leptidea sinapis TaxID=189913 RepID=A0A5E4R9Q7_9NEOP|nr:unnamed protein product [Leptidea sinapis]